MKEFLKIVHALQHLHETCHVLSQVFLVCVIRNCKTNCKISLFLKLFGQIAWHFVTLATIQKLFSPLLNVSDHTSTQCLCLGLQHSAA